jgi:hypothetical protein
MNKPASLVMNRAVVLGLLIAGTAFADQKSEQAASELLHRRLQHDDPQAAQLLQLVQGRDVVVVRGSMDHIENVLQAARIPHTLIEPNQVADWQLNSKMIVMVDCPGMVPDAAVKRIERFVRAGGLLYTTDWALKNLVEKAFPGTIAATGNVTGSEVVPVKVDHEGGDIMSQVLAKKGSQPEWWLEGGSFPIKVLDQSNVDVLAHSDVMKQRYGASPIVVHFRHDDGEVIHVVSHFYRQMATQNANVAANQAVDAYEGLTEKDRRELKPALGGVTSGDVESSYAFQRMTSNIVTGKQKKNVELDKIYNQTVRGEAQLHSAPATSAPAVANAKHGTRMKVLSRKGNQVQVRDDQGNEGWLSADSLESY